jgi:phosphoribosylformylglycinamidine (FGAM) synthase-like enzyme
LKLPARWEAALFGEQQSRIVVSLQPDRLESLRMLATQQRVPMTMLGKTGGERFTMGGEVDIALSEIDDAWSNGLERALTAVAA